MFEKRFKRKIFNLFRNLFHKNEKENIKDIGLSINDDGLTLLTKMYANYESNILDKWITLPLNYKNIDSQNVNYNDLFYNDKLDNIIYNTLDDLSNDNNKSKKDNIKKSPILFNMSIVLMGIISGLVLSQFLSPGFC